MDKLITNKQIRGPPYTPVTLPIMCKCMFRKSLKNKYSLVLITTYRYSCTDIATIYYLFALISLTGPISLVSCYNLAIRNLVV